MKQRYIIIYTNLPSDKVNKLEVVKYTPDLMIAKPMKFPGMQGLPDFYIQHFRFSTQTIDFLCVATTESELKPDNWQPVIDKIVELLVRKKLVKRGEI